MSDPLGGATVPSSLGKCDILFHCFGGMGLMILINLFRIGSNKGAVINRNG